MIKDVDGTVSIDNISRFTRVAAPFVPVAVRAGTTLGEIITSPVTVQFGLEGVGVAPAGVQIEKIGHHHLLIDVGELPDMSKLIPSDDHHQHFGGGQTPTTLELAPGQHSLQLLLGDHMHAPHDLPVMSKEITITVE